MRVMKKREQAPTGMRTVWTTDYSADNGRIQVTIISKQQMPGYVTLEWPPPVTNP